MADERYKMLLRIPVPMAMEMLGEARHHGVSRTAMITTLIREALDARRLRREVERAAVEGELVGVGGRDGMVSEMDGARVA